MIFTEPHSNLCDLCDVLCVQRIVSQIKWPTKRSLEKEEENCKSKWKSTFGVKQVIQKLYWEPVISNQMHALLVICKLCKQFKDKIQLEWPTVHGVKVKAPKMGENEIR